MNTGSIGLVGATDISESGGDSALQLVDGNISERGADHMQDSEVVARRRALVLATRDIGEQDIGGELFDRASLLFSDPLQSQHDWLGQTDSQGY